MCTILGYLGGDLSPEEFRGYLLRAKTRGPDDCRVEKTPFGLLGFGRLAVMGLTEEGMQPFRRDGGWAVCNGELYGFRALRAQLERRGYRFSGGSDCELLLPLYREYGAELFRHLDAEFACVLCDGATGKVLAARDPVGIRPLFYGYSASGHIASFASEAKCLVGWIKEILPFPPGQVWCDGVFTPFADIGDVPLYTHAPEEELTANLREKLIRAVEKRLDADAPLGFLLSGGLDSSLVCAIAARKLGRPIRTFAIGMEGDAIDLGYARQVAAHLGAEHTEVRMTKAQVLAAVPEVTAALGTYDITTIRAGIGMYLVCQVIHKTTELKVLLTGEVSDELFGYKYTDFAPNAREFQREAQKRMRELYAYDVLRADRCLAAHSLEARVPFADLEFARYVMSIDPAKK